MSRVIVIGAGFGGLVAANRLADAGVKVALVTKGLGGLQLGQGTIDVLGYRPERVSNPMQELAGPIGVRGVSDQLPHPYTTIGSAAVHDGLGYLKRILPDLLVGDPETNLLLPTAVGALRPTCLAQPSMLAGQARSGKKLLIVGFQRLKDFPAKLVAQNLARTDLPDKGRMSTRDVVVDLVAREGEIDSSGLAFARALDDPATQARLVALVKPLLADDEIVGFPAVLGLRNAGVWQAVSDQLGHQVFEIPLPPPSVPGIRLNSALTDRAKSLGVRMVPGARTVSFRADAGGVRSVTIDTVPAPREFVGDAFVLATGGFESGALAMDSYGTVRETLFDLPLIGVEGTLLHGDYWGAEQPLFRAGVAVDAAMRPLDEDKPVYPNLHAVGGLLAGSSRWAEKSGDGIALGSAIRAAEAILEARA